MANPTREDFIAAARARYSTQQQAPTDTNEQGIFSDTVDMFQRGLGQTLGGDLETVGQIADSQGLKDAGRGVSAWADGQLQEVSTPMREAMGKQFFQENAETGAIEAGDAWADPRAWAGNFATVLGQFTGLVGAPRVRACWQSRCCVALASCWPRIWWRAGARTGGQSHGEGCHSGRGARLGAGCVSCRAQRGSQARSAG
ncbi:hypothetical protein ACSZM7_16025 [Aeromonas veronii]